MWRMIEAFDIREDTEGRDKSYAEKITDMKKDMEKDIDELKKERIKFLEETLDLAKDR